MGAVTRARSAGELARGGSLLDRTSPEPSSCAGSVPHTAGIWSVTRTATGICSVTRTAAMRSVVRTDGMGSVVRSASTGW
jgi:hypothetical protein